MNGDNDNKIVLPMSHNSVTAIHHACTCHFTNYAFVLTIVERVLILLNFHVVLINMFTFYYDLIYST